MLLAICLEFDIPYTFLSENKRLQIFNDAATAKNYSGICTHANFRIDKFDIGPAFDWNFFKQLHLPQFEMSQENIKKSYQQIDINCLNQFPIASYGWWHNGIHLSCNKKSPLYSICDGQVVYSRISTENHHENGSPNFVLIKYQLDINQSKITFYVLYMHLEKIDIQTNLTNKEDVNKLPLWIKQKFYTKKGIISDVYSDGCVSLYRDNAGTPTTKELYKLFIGDEFDIIESSKPFGSYEITKVKYSGKEGWIYNRDNKGRYYCQLFLSLHSWAVDSDQNPRKEVFQNALSFEQPINVFSGQIIGYTSDALSHIEILQQNKIIKKKKTQCHLEIFSKKRDHNNKDIYAFLASEPENYILLEDQNDDILSPQIERTSLINELEKKIPEFKEFKKQNNSIDSLSNRSIINKENLKKFVNDFHIKFRDCVALHITSWQALNNRIQSRQYPSIDELKCYYLFTPSDKKKILDQNEKLFFYHPIRFIEIINNLLNNKNDDNKQNSTQDIEITTNPVVEPVLILNLTGPANAKVYDQVTYTAELISEDENNNKGVNNLNIRWTIKKKSTNEIIQNIIGHDKKFEYSVPHKVINDIIIVTVFANELSLEKSIETEISYSFSGEVFWSARDLAEKPLGNHHFITVKFTNKQSADIFYLTNRIPYRIMDSKYFFTVAGFLNEENENLECEFNNKYDVISVQENINPDLKGFRSDYDYESHPINPPSRMNSQEFIEKIVQLSLNYLENQKTESIEYSVANYNCAAWVNTLFKKIGISDNVRLKKGEFSGFDWGEEDTFASLDKMFDKK